MKVGDIKRLPKIKGNGYFIVKVVGLNIHEGVQYAEVVPVDFNGDVREVNADRLLDLMTKEDAKKTLKENICAMCSYGCQNMDSCDIKSCDNRDAIKALEQEPCAEERYQDLVEYFGDEDIAKCILEDREEFKKWLERVRWHTRKVDELARELDQEPCEDSVSRKVILSKIKEVCFSDKWLQFRVNKGSHGQRDFIIDYIEKLPPVTPERKKAKWVKLYFGSMYDVCSECWQRVTTGYFEYNYCPSCGAEMQTKENDI